MKIFRSLFAGLLAAASMIPGNVTAQVLFCPVPPELSADKAETEANAKTMLERLSIAFDLNGHEGIDEASIVRAHAETPGALLAKLSNVADRCAYAAADGQNTFYKHLSELRRLFVEATLVDAAAKVGAKKDGRVALKQSPVLADLVDEAASKRSVDLSVRGLWRKLWFRSPSGSENSESRWAVIVASPADADEGWALLGDYQKRWEDVYFQLHQPYYDNNNHHAIVVGRKLPHEEAERLLDYVKELGMPEDSYLWPVPVDKAINVVSSNIRIEELEANSLVRNLDLSVLSNDSVSR